MIVRQVIDRERAAAAALTLLAVLALGYALVAGLRVALPLRPAAVMRLFSLAAPPPPVERPPPPHPRHATREGASAPPNLRSRATEVAALRPIVPPIQPPPIAVAPLPAVGLDASSGAALVAGPGSGAGGRGEGTGSGRGGDGPGGGGTPARLVSDTLRIRDLPSPIIGETLSAGQHLAVYMRFTVGVTGRVTDCAVTRSSGDAALDTATCAATMRKLRYRPELDGAGHPIAVTFVGVQEWSGLNADPPPGGDRDGD